MLREFAVRSEFLSEKFRGQFSGHETFPLRHGWLKKAYDEVQNEGNNADRSLFCGPEAIIRFGVGKNMATAIRHWALACGIITEDKGHYRSTDIGDFLLGSSGVDPYLENPASLWLLQWLVAGSPERTTTWYWTFNHLPSLQFERASLVETLIKLVADRKWSRITPATIKRDVDCFLRMYVPKKSSKGGFSEESVESPFGELSLIKQVGPKEYQFRRGPRHTLPDEVFFFALVSFWSRFTTARTLSIEAIAYEPGSPGRVFKLDEDSIVDRLVMMDEKTGGKLTWSDTSGLRQVLWKIDFSEQETFELLRSAYGDPAERRAA